MHSNISISTKKFKKNCKRFSNLDYMREIKKINVMYYATKQLEEHENKNSEVIILNKLIA